MFLKSKPLSFKIALVLCVALGIAFAVHRLRSNDTTNQTTVPEPEAPKSVKPKQVHGIHLTSWVAGSKKARQKIETLLKETELNTVVIAVKEYEGEVYIPGVPIADKYKLYVNAIPDVQEYLAHLKEMGIYTIARVVVFKDRNLPKKKPEWGVKRPDGELWTDHKKNTWVDPYNHDVWEYNISIASRAIALGFQEIQFDYIRFPSDGDIKLCRYSYAHHDSTSAAKALDDFLELASKRLKPLGANVSIDIFGLTPSVQHDMGIGQKIVQMTQWVDFVSPMVYPSHYAKGEYGIPDPNRVPYHVVYRTMSDAKRRLGELHTRVRPYLQDFSLGYKYGPKEVRAQILACEDLGFDEWLLWSPSCNYTKAALKSKDGILPETAKVPQSMIYHPPEHKEKEAKEKKSAKEETAKPESSHEKAEPASAPNPAPEKPAETPKIESAKPVEPSTPTEQKNQEKESPAATPSAK